MGDTLVSLLGWVWDKGRFVEVDDEARDAVRGKRFDWCFVLYKRANQHKSPSKPCRVPA